jgi:hypothetical protein
MKKVYSGKISFVPTNDALPGELSSKIVEKCIFCQKSIEINACNALVIKKLSGPERTFCPFCLRHGFYTKRNKHILILSFRSLIASLYYHTYASHTRKLWLSQIQEYIEAHEYIGLKNPVFFYDPETYLWFIDFSRVGTGKKEVPIIEVHRTILNILTCFNLANFLGPDSPNEIFVKYRDAIDLFYEKRFRPKRRRMLIPTFPTHLKIAAEKFRNFLPKNLKK